MQVGELLGPGAIALSEPGKFGVQKIFSVLGAENRNPSRMGCPKGRTHHPPSIPRCSNLKKTICCRHTSIFGKVGTFQSHPSFCCRRPSHHAGTHLAVDGFADTAQDPQAGEVVLLDWVIPELHQRTDRCLVQATASGGTIPPKWKKNKIAKQQTITISLHEYQNIQTHTEANIRSRQRTHLTARFPNANDNLSWIPKICSAMTCGELCKRW